MDVLAATLDENLVRATWGLVLATFLLVIAAAIPAVRAILDRRAQKRRIAAQLVPDMRILGPRLERTVVELSASDSPSSERLALFLQWWDVDLDILSPLVQLSSDVGLHFANEMYICRHLLTQAKLELTKAQDSVAEPPMEEAFRSRVANVHRAANLYLAAQRTLEEAERSLPAWTRQVEGKDFWERFQEVSTKREDEAETELVARRQRQRRR